MRTMWRQHGDHRNVGTHMGTLETTCGQHEEHGDNMGTTGMCRPCGDNMETTCGQRGCGDNVEITWGSDHVGLKM